MATRVAVLASGGGTNFENLAHRAGDIGIEIAVLVTDSADAFAINRAEQLGIPYVVHPRGEHPSKSAHESAIIETLRTYDISYVLLAGYMRILSAGFIESFERSIINVHPSLLPSYGGKGYYDLVVHRAVLEAGESETGCTVHFCDNEYDHGPIIVQQAVPVLDDDTPDTLAARVFEAECEAFPEAIRRFATGRLTVDGNRAVLK